MLQATCYVLQATCYVLHATGYMLHATGYMLRATCPRNHVSIFGSVLRFFSVQIVQSASGLHLASYPVADAAGACVLESIFSTSVPYYIRFY